MRTSEWVSLGHSDKVADAISEYILDRYLEKDSNTRYALECQIKDNYVTLSGEITSNYEVSDYQYYKWVKEAVNKIGYTKEYQNHWGEENTICADDLQVVTHISKQSVDIAQGVHQSGWGDQGIFFGYAENNKDTNYMPLDHFLAKDLGLMLFDMASKPMSNVGLDIKTQITLTDENIVGQVIIAIPMLSDCINELKKEVIQWGKKYKQKLQDEDIIINGTGIYKKHGPIADCGTTGRKLAVDFYGGNSKIGGGSPWTKDSTKADLTLNLYARELALHYLQRNEGVEYTTSSLSCCIGNNSVIISLKAYDKNGLLIDKEEYIELTNLEYFAETYNLTSPKFFDMNKNGLFEEIQ